MLNIKKALTKILSDITPSQDDYSSAYGTIRASKQSGVVTLQFDGLNMAYSSGWNTIGTIGTKYRPARNTYVLAVNNAATTNNALPMEIRIAPSGDVSVYKFSETSTNQMALGQITYYASSRGG